MRLRSLTPHPSLAPFIHHFWVFESDEGLPQGDARVVVPNGRHKLIVPFRNGLTAARIGEEAGAAQHHEPGDAVLLHTSDRAEAERLLEADPGVRGGRLRIELMSDVTFLAGSVRF
jgi:hypothetical protein